MKGQGLPQGGVPVVIETAQDLDPGVGGRGCTDLQ